MSAFVVEPATINAIVAHLRHNDSIIAGKLALNWQGLAEAMHQMNVDAVTWRYDDKTLPEEWTTFRFQSVMPPPRVAAYKALLCYLYQCSEGNIVKRDLYRLLDNHVNELAHEIVHDLPQYQSANV